VYVVTPSTSGRNLLPLALARWLQVKFGGEVFDRLDSNTAQEAKNRRGYIEKVSQPTRIVVPLETAQALSGRRVIVVDDILTSGETLNAVQEALAVCGVRVDGVVVLGAAQGARPASESVARQLSKHLARELGLDWPLVLESLRLAHANAYASLLRKAAQDAENQPHKVYETIRQKGAALREAARLDVSGKPAPQSDSDPGRIEGPGGVGGLLQMAERSLADPGAGIYAEVRPLAGGKDQPGGRAGAGACRDASALSRVTLEDLVPFIDWTPFFHTWELRGVYPKILQHEKHGEEARKLFADAQAMLQRITRERLLTPRGVYGLFPANRVGDDVEIYTDETRATVRATLRFLRQQMAKEDGSPNWCLADFIAPRGTPDHIGAFAVTAGHEVKAIADEFKRAHDDYSAILIEAVGDRLAEAFAEYLHKRVRDEWGFGRAENFTNEDLIAEKYRGIRPAAGYPACPDHTEKAVLWALLDVERHTGITLTESFAMNPGSSVSGLYFAHPEAKYFAVGRLGRDQVEDYARRKGESPVEMERWLGPWLGYAT
ncbi:MAG: vitamin B12 dependent-methionine synthase activation domain-containing protein, partial [Limisphaerales bacterium]